MIRTDIITECNKDPPVSKDIQKVKGELQIITYKKGIKLMIKIEKIYTANSNIDEFNGIKNVTFHWYYGDREWVDANYNSIIKGYEDMTSEDKRKAEEVINEYFTIDEIEFIRPYLKSKFNNIDVEEVSLPLNVKYFDQEDNEVRIKYPFSFTAYGYNTICLDKQEDYDLPFNVWGYIYPNINTPK